MDRWIGESMVSHRNHWQAKRCTVLTEAGTQNSYTYNIQILKQAWNSYIGNKEENQESCKKYFFHSAQKHWIFIHFSQRTISHIYWKKIKNETKNHKNSAFDCAADLRERKRSALYKQHYTV